jgi:hypothetical protein
LYASSLKCFFLYLLICLCSSLVLVVVCLFDCLFSSELRECSVVVVIIMLYSSAVDAAAAADYYSAVAAVV